MGRLKDVIFDISERVMEACQQGFECREEMDEEFQAIAEEFNVPVSWVYETYSQGDFV